MCVVTALTALGVSASTASAVSAGVGVAGAAASAYGAYNQAQGQKRAAEYNAKVSEYAAQRATEKGERERMQVENKARAVAGQQRTQFAARGLDINQGSPLSLLQETDYYSQLDAEDVRYNASVDAWQHRTQGTAYSNQAASINPALAAGTTFLTEAGAVSDSWSSGKASNKGGDTGHAYGNTSTPKSTSRSPYSGNASNFRLSGGSTIRQGANKVRFGSFR